MAARASQNNCCLLSVPSEIRWSIYPYLFQNIRIRCDRRTQTLGRSTTYWLHLDLPSEFEVLLTCRQIYDEGRQIFYGGAVFELSDLINYGTFFDSLPSAIREHVRTIEGVKITRGVHSHLMQSMKPEATELDQWLTNFTGLTRLTIIVDTIVTLQDEKYEGVAPLDRVTFDEIVDAITSPVTSTGRQKWSLRQLTDLIEKHAAIDFAVILKLRTVSTEFRGAKSIDKVLVQLDVRKKTFHAADDSFSDGIFIGQDSSTQAALRGAGYPSHLSRRIAFTRGGIFAL